MKQQENFLKIVSDIQGNELETAAFNIREDSQCAGRQSTPNIKIDSKEDEPGTCYTHKQKCTKETVYIPACVTHGDVDDLVYNDFMLRQVQTLLLLPVAVCIHQMVTMHDITEYTVSLSVKVHTFV